MPDIILMGCSAEQTRVLSLGSLFLLGKLPVTERLALIAPDSRFQLATFPLRLFLLHLQQMIILESVNADRQTNALQTPSGRLPLLSAQTGPTQIDKLLSGMTSRSGDVVCALCAAAYFVHGPSPCCSQRAVGYGWNLIGDFIPGFFTLLLLQSQFVSAALTERESLHAAFYVQAGVPLFQYMITIPINLAIPYYP